MKQQSSNRTCKLYEGDSYKSLYTILNFGITIVSVEDIKLNRGGRSFESREGVGCNCILGVMHTGLYKKYL